MRKIHPPPPLALALLLAASTALFGAVAFATSRAPPVPSAGPKALLPDLNASPERHLLLIPGIGPARARSIVEERSRSGPFASAADLDRVPGIGPATAGALALFLQDRAGPEPTGAGP